MGTAAFHRRSSWSKPVFKSGETCPWSALSLRRWARSSSWATAGDHGIDIEQFGITSLRFPTGRERRNFKRVGHGVRVNNCVPEFKGSSHFPLILECGSEQLGSTGRPPRARVYFDSPTMEFQVRIRARRRKCEKGYGCWVLAPGADPPRNSLFPSAA